MLGQVYLTHPASAEATNDLESSELLAFNQPEGLTPTPVTSDANETRLESERSRVRGDVDRMQRQLDEWARQAYMGNPDIASKDQIAELAAKLSEQQKYLGDLDSVHEALGKADETYLTVFDPRTGTGKPVLAAVAVGNPDTAKNVSVTVPGVGSTTKDSLPSMVSEANALRAETLRQLHLEGLPESAATIAWMGFDPPPNPINTMSPADAIATMNDGQAVPGAHSLSNYLEQLHQNNPDGHLTLFGHSYGSLTSSLAYKSSTPKGCTRSMTSSSMARLASSYPIPPSSASRTGTRS